MSSLAYWAAPINDNTQILSNIEKTETPIARKRATITTNNSDRVNKILKNIHDKKADDNDEDDDEDDERNTNSTQNQFNPPPLPVSIGVENTRIQDTADSTDNRSLKNNYMTSDQAIEYNNSMSFNQQLNPLTSQFSTQPSQNEVLLKKLNYIIHLIEEQQDEKTNNVTEEVVLYSFLGVFVIFVVDSFVKVGKYVR